MSIWNLFTDISFIAILLVVGQFLRAKVKFLQMLLIPPALIAGIIGLILGGSGLGIIPFSKSLDTYAAMLILFVFSSMPIGDKITGKALVGRDVGGMFANITGVALMQYWIGLFVTIYGLKLFFADLNPGFGLIMATGFYGGYGTAAALGTIYNELGWNAARGLGYTSATVGLILGIVLGMVIVNWAARKGYTLYVKSPGSLPEEMRTGLLPPEKQALNTKLTTSNVSMDSQAFHLGILLIAPLLGYYSSAWLKMVFPAVTIPDFCMGLIFGFVINWLLFKTAAVKYVDKATVSRMRGTATDLLVVSGIASISIRVVLDYFVPLIVIFAVGCISTWLWFYYIGSRCSTKAWFERNIMTWGHAMGVTATGIMLLRIVDPDMQSRAMEDTGIVQVVNRVPVVMLQVVPPVLMAQSVLMEHVCTWVIFACLVGLMILAYALKWWDPGARLVSYNQNNSVSG